MHPARVSFAPTKPQHPRICGQAGIRVGSNASCDTSVFKEKCNTKLHITALSGVDLERSCERPVMIVAHQYGVLSSFF